MNTIPTADSRPSLRVFLVALALLSSLSVLWALASPIFSSPDENAHAVKAIAQVRGDLTGHAEPDARHPVVDLPPGYSYPSGIVCFAYQADVSADCGPELGSPGGSPDFSTWVARYFPLYYYLVGWPTLVIDGSAGIYAMRIVSAILCSALAAAAIAFLATRRALFGPLAAVFLASPMVLYMMSSVTPQGLEIVAAALLWTTLPRLLETFAAGEAPAARRLLWIAVVVSASLLATAKALGPLWVVLIVGFCLLWGGRSAARALFTTRSTYAWISPIALMGLLSVGWTLGGGALSGQADEADTVLVGGTFLEGVWAMIRVTPWHIQQAAGIFGWLDTYLPTMVYVVFFAAFAIPVVLAVLGVDRRSTLRLGALILLALATPVIVQSLSVAQTGIIWQGRYALFLYIAIPLLAGVLLSAEPARRLWHLATPLSFVIAGAIGAYGLAAFVLVLRRYVVGMDDHITAMLSAPEWSPPLGWIPLTAAYGLISILGVVVVGRATRARSSAALGAGVP